MQTILVVDDCADVYRPLTALIRHLGFDGQYATGGVEALEIVKTLLPSLIILDAMMPDMDGVEVLRHLKEDPKTSNIPVVMFSAIVDPQFKAHVLSKGAADYWVKAGIDFTELRIRLAKLIRVMDS